MQQRDKLASQANAAIEQPRHLMQARFEAQRGQALAALAQQAAGGRVNVADAQHLYDRGLISEEQFKYFTGSKPSEGSDPNVLANLKAQIAEEPLGTEPSDIYRAGVSHADAAQLVRELREQQHLANTMIGATARQLYRRLLNRFFPPPMVVINPEERNRRIAQFRDDFNAMVKEAKSVKDLCSIEENLEKIYPLPDEKPSAKVPPPMLPGETVGAYRKRMTDGGF